MMQEVVHSPPASLIFSSTLMDMETLPSPPPTPGRKRMCYSLDKKAVGEIPMFFESSRSLIHEKRPRRNHNFANNSENREEDPSNAFARLVASSSVPITPFRLAARPVFGTRIPTTTTTMEKEDARHEKEKGGTTPNASTSAPRTPETLSRIDNLPPLPFDFPTLPSSSSSSASSSLSTKKVEPKPPISVRPRAVAPMARRVVRTVSDPQALEFNPIISSASSSASTTMATASASSTSASTTTTSTSQTTSITSNTASSSAGQCTRRTTTTTKLQFFQRGGLSRRPNAKEESRRNSFAARSA